LERIGGEMLKKKFIANYSKEGEIFQARVAEYQVFIFEADTFIKLEEWVRECIAEDLECDLNDFDLEFVKAEKAVS
jgi:hypothetical protein